MTLAVTFSQFQLVTNPDDTSFIVGYMTVNGVQKEIRLPYANVQAITNAVTQANNAATLATNKAAAADTSASAASTSATNAANSAAASASSASAAAGSEAGAATSAGIATNAANNAQASSRSPATWAFLSGLTPTVIGEGAEVPETDTGTHTDPSTSATVPNSGRFMGYALTAGAWTRTGGTGLSSKADKVDTDPVVDAFETVYEVMESKTATGSWLTTSNFGAWALLMKPGIDAPVGAVRDAIEIPLVQVAATATKIRYRLSTRDPANSETTSPSIGSPDVLVETQDLSLAAVGITANAAPATMRILLANPYTIPNTLWTIFDWEALDGSNARVASGQGYRPRGSDSAGQGGWYRNSLTANWGLLNSSFSLCRSLLAKAAVLKESALPNQEVPPAALTRDEIESCTLSVSGQNVIAAVTFVRNGVRSTYNASVAVASTTTGSVTSGSPEARTLSNPLSGTSKTYAYSPTGGQLTYANATSVVVRRASDSVVLTENTDYLLNGDHGAIVRATAGADVPVTVTYNWAQTRYSLLYIDAETGTIALIGGSQKVRGAAEFTPVPSSSTQIPLGVVRAVGTSVTVQPVWKVDRGFIHADLAAQWSRDIARNKACLRSTLAALRRGQDVDVISYGDSIVAMQNSSPSANVPNTAARDRAVSTNGYLLSPANIIDASLIAAIPTYDTGDGAGQVHTRFGFAWDMVQAMRAAYGGTVNVYNLGIGGTNSGNTSNGGTETNHLAALVALIAASVAAGRRVLVLVNYGMNEIGNTSTESRVIAILAAIFAAGGSSQLADAIVASTARRNIIDVGYTDDQWRLTNRALRRAAEYVDPTTGKSAAFIDMQALFDDAFNVLGLHRLDNAGANYTNHPGIREHKVMGLAASSWVD